MAKIQNNQKCPCGSGRKYKQCCKDKAIKGHSIQFLGHDSMNDGDLGSDLLRHYTGYGPKDYIQPVRLLNNNLFDVISDESVFKSHYGISLVIYRNNDNKKYNRLLGELNKLVAEHGITNIHFTDIFTRKILGSSRDSFLKGYIDIVGQLELSCVAVSVDKDRFLKQFGVSDASDDDMYHNLFWLAFDKLLSTAKDDYIINIWKEQDNNLSDKYNMELHMKMLDGLNYVIPRHPDKYLSVCRYPAIFTKDELLKSSLSDFVAYTVNKIQNKIDSGIPIKKISKEYEVHLKMLKEIFTNYTGLPSKELYDLVDQSMP